MAFDFPSGPQVGQTYTSAPGMPTYMWNGVSWDVMPAQVSPGTLVELDRKVVTTAVNTVAFTSGIDATYDEYELHWYNLKVSLDGALGLRVSGDGGGTFKGGANDYLDAVAMAQLSSGLFTSSTTTTYARLSPLISAAAGGAVAHGRAWFVRPWDATIVKMFQTNAFQYNPTGTYSSWVGVTGFNGGTSGYQFAVNAFQLFPSVGNFTSGTFVLYGRSKSPVAPLPGARVLLRTIDMTGLTTIDLPFGTVYDTYEIDGHWLAGAVAGAPRMQLSIDGGATFRSGATDYATAGEEAWHTVSGSTPGWSNAGQLAPYIKLGAGFGQPSAALPLDFNIKVRRPSVALPVNPPRLFEISAVAHDATSSMTRSTLGGQLYNSWSPVTHARLTTTNAVAMLAGSYTKLYGW